MAMSIWRCHTVADTYTQCLTEPTYHKDNSKKHKKYHDKATKYAFIILSILVSASCPKIVQWDTINYNQAAFCPRSPPNQGMPYYASHAYLRRHLVNAQKLYFLFWPSFTPSVFQDEIQTI